MLDLMLAMAHHLLMFGLFAVLAIEVMVVQRGMDAAAVRRVAAIDLWYGILAVLIVAAGFARAIFAAKGWDYYAHNIYFWSKITAFVVIGLLSIVPTVSFLQWKRAGAAPTDSAVGRVRSFILAQIALFALLPILAASMARGYGQM